VFTGFSCDKLHGVDANLACLKMEIKSKKCMVCLQRNRENRKAVLVKNESLSTRERCCHCGFVFISTIRLNKYFRERKR